MLFRQKNALQADQRLNVTLDKAQPAAAGAQHAAHLFELKGHRGHVEVVLLQQHGLTAELLAHGVEPCLQR